MDLTQLFWIAEIQDGEAGSQSTESEALSRSDHIIFGPQWSWENHNYVCLCRACPTLMS